LCVPLGETFAYPHQVHTHPHLQTTARGYLVRC